MDNSKVCKHKNHQKTNTNSQKSKQSSLKSKDSGLSPEPSYDKYPSESGEFLPCLNFHFPTSTTS
ncbi:CLUMA_CG010355, isoform A [Clunio marinus]|uniref:CLUMA_CG010355, isoform A n=1 Tax=Clunio marinus TaxID=568069 RepID=A0A1J1IBK3_9DIPT|nr:CLUMA_CG010355, isoform A [Clunio marinus]